MAENRIDATLAAADRDAVLAAIQSARQRLPFLVDLTPEERRALPKMGDKSRAFVQRALEVADQNPDILPRAFDTATMRRDVNLFVALEPVALATAQFQELVDDTLTAVGNEAYLAALLVYRYARESGKGAALDDVADLMSRRFARAAAKKAQP